MKNGQGNGFTMIELIVVISIVSTLMSLAVPSFSSIRRDSLLRSQISDFHLSILLARNEAISRLSRVTVCRSNNGKTCNASSWAQGWIIFLDGDNDATVNAEDEIIHVYSALKGNNRLVGNRPVASYISYVGNGRSMRTSGALQMGTFVLCDDLGFDYGRAIVINASSRPSIREATASSFEDCAIP